MQNYAKLTNYAKNYAIMHFGPNYANYVTGPKLCDKNYANYALHKPRSSALHEASCLQKSTISFIGAI